MDKTILSVQNLFLQLVPTFGYASSRERNISLHTAFIYFIFLFFVPCLFRKLSIMLLHYFLSFVALSKGHYFPFTPNPYSANDSRKYVK